MILLITLSQTMARRTIHKDVLFDLKLKHFINNVSITVDESTGLITDVIRRAELLPQSVPHPDIDLRGKVVFPGFVDAHTHIFLHGYE